jgi:hypothetical protein
MVPVAQLAEHLTVDQVVAGSNPVRHPTKYGRFREESLILSICGGFSNGDVFLIRGFGCSSGAIWVQFYKRYQIINSYCYFVLLTGDQMTVRIKGNRCFGVS